MLLLSRGLLAFAAFGTSASSDVCPCSEPTLCSPISTGARKEVFGFTVTNGASWKQGYDWDQLTTIAWANDPQVMCHAHAKGARAVLSASFPAAALTNATTRAEWVANHVKTALANHLDGTNFDYESAIAFDSPTRKQYTDLIAETTAAFHKAIPGSQVTVDVAWSPDDIDGRSYDWTGIAQASDFLFVMGYDTRSQIYGRCIASANTPFEVARRGIERYMQLGIPAEKLVLGLPWYGYDYPCNTTDPAVEYCTIQAVPFQNVTCSDAAGKERNYADVRKLLASSNATTGRRWEPTLQSPYFNYRAYDGSIHQVWYDDPESLSRKYELAKSLGIRGIGFWSIDSLDYDGSVEGKAGMEQAAQMWQAVKAFTGPGAGQIAI